MLRKYLDQAMSIFCPSHHSPFNLPSHALKSKLLTMPYNKHEERCFVMSSLFHLSLNLVISILNFQTCSYTFIKFIANNMKPPRLCRAGKAALFHWNIEVITILWSPPSTSISWTEIVGLWRRSKWRKHRACANNVAKLLHQYTDIHSTSCYQNQCLN